MTSSGTAADSPAAGPLYLSGMPGAGKSTVGRMLARVLAVPFVDLDARFAQRYGLAAGEAITRHGEGWFREREAALLRSVAKRAGVVACGGGTLAQEENLAWALAHGTVVSLLASPETLARRLEDASAHPLLAGEEFVGRLRALLRERRAFYDRAPVQVTTDGLSPAQVAFAIRQRLVEQGLASTYRPTCSPAGFEDVTGGREAFVELGPRSYPVRLHEGRGLGALQAFVDEVLGERSRVLVVDDGVWRRYGRSLRKELGEAAVNPLVLPAGEDAKALSRLGEYVDGLLRAGATRATGLVAVGGGSALDVAGFLASVYMRGIRAVYVPTTLLAAVDAGVGGKTGMNTAQAKNVAGTFQQPCGVWVPLDWVAGHGEAGFADGAAEFLKMWLLAGADEAAVTALAQCRDGQGAAVRHGLADAVALGLTGKIDVVTADEREVTGERTLLNLGHTFAHVVEAASGYAISHGRAVGWGLVVAARISERLRLADAGLSRQVEGLAARLGLWPPPELALSAGDLERVAFDKKRRGENVRLVLLRGPGEPVAVELSAQEAKKLLAQVV